MYFDMLQWLALLSIETGNVFKLYKVFVSYNGTKALFSAVAANS